MFAGMQTQPDLGIDTSTYLSPMDLYDQIFWGTNEPPPPLVFPAGTGPNVLRRMPRTMELGLRLDEL